MYPSLRKMEELFLNIEVEEIHKSLKINQNTIEKKGNLIMSKNESSLIKTIYNNECPDCGDSISENVLNGDQCENCGFIFWLETEDVEISQY